MKSPDIKIMQPEATTPETTTPTVPLADESSPALKRRLAAARAKRGKKKGILSTFLTGVSGQLGDLATPLASSPPAISALPTLVGG